MNRNNKTAIIFGVTGQIGSYLLDSLIEEDYFIYGVSRRTSTPNTYRIKNHLNNSKFKLIHADITDTTSLFNLFNTVWTEWLSKNAVNEHFEIFNFAAQSVTEDCLCPILSADKLDYITLGKLWKEQVKKHHEIKIEKMYDGNEVEVINLSDKSQLKALGYWNGMGTWFKIKQISRHKWNGKVVRLTQKFGSVTVTPNHSLLNVKQQICSPSENPWLLSVRKINYKPNKFHDEIRLSLTGIYNYDDEWFWKNEKGDIGKIKKNISGDVLKSFCRFLGAYITEGCLSINKNKIYEVTISQQNKEWLEELEKDLNTFFIGRRSYTESKKEGYKNVWNLRIKSRALFNLMEKLCGKKSSNKKLPHWFTQLRPDCQLELFNKMIEGDGCICEFGWRYTTVSYKLACQLSWLVTSLGFDYTVNFVKAENAKKANFDQWHFRECQTYQINQGENGKKIEYLDYDGFVYDISVEEVNNFAVGVGNIVVHNSHVGESFNQPGLTWDVTAKGQLNLLEVLRHFHTRAKFKTFFMSSSETFGYNVDEDGFQRETTKMLANSPYGVAKLSAFNLSNIYKNSYGMDIRSGIIFNSESPRRGEEFVTRKITKWFSEYIVNKYTFKERLKLGNLDACRDWTHAIDTVKAIRLIMGSDKSDNYVVSSGQTQSIFTFLQKCYEFTAKLNDCCSDLPHKLDELYEIDKNLYRPCEVPMLKGDSSKLRNELGWSHKITIDELVEDMIITDMGLSLKC